MNKLRIAILITVFLSFTILGFTAAQRLGHDIFVKPVAAARETSSTSSQKNILIIRVDDLKDPDLVSVWIVFAANYDKPYISFKSLYPDPLTGFRPAPIRTLFSLQKDGSLSAPFVKWLQDMQVEWDGYFLMDQYGLTQFGQWMTGQEPSLNAVIPINREQSRLVFQEESQMYQKICDSLSLPVNPRQPEMRWADLAPDHMQTDFDLKTAIVNWEQIDALQNPHCEVLNLP